MRVGFIGLGNVGGKLAGSLLRNGFELTVRDLDVGVAQHFFRWGRSGQTRRRLLPAKAIWSSPVCPVQPSARG
jgi:3-hydroxyisobutyrate dehydrogenase